EANRIVEDILADEEAETVVKSKSMTTEEIDLNDAIGQDYEVVETDLGEFVIQVADESPSHMIGPAMHKSSAEIATLFNDVFDPAEPLDADPTELTEFAKERVGEHIREADVGVTGANFVVAESGSIMLVTNEGNARKTAVTPETHVAVTGVEKIVPSVTDLQPFTELIAKSGTGQSITSYVSHLTPPVDTPIPDFEADEFRPATDRSFHLVLLDNGRMEMREDEHLRETLYCIRCGACSNACANFQTVGGHAFGGDTYSGGIGTGWEAGVADLDVAGDMSDLCTGCTRCEPKCPVKIDIPWINTVVRDRRNRSEASGNLDLLVEGLTPDDEPSGLDLQQRFFGNLDTVATIGSIAPGVANALANTSVVESALERFLGIDDRRDLPSFAPETFRSWYDERGSQVPDADETVVVYPDLYTNYFDPERGKAAVRTLEALDVAVRVPDVPESGRAPLSQGMISTATTRAKVVHERLVSHIDAGEDVVVIEPSDLAMFRSEYDHLLPEASFDRLAAHSHDVMEYVARRLDALEDEAIDTLSGPKETSAVSLHTHCQQRTLEFDGPTEDVLERLGYDLDVSDTECCGMAGSFGYKREYFEVSESIGADLKEDMGDVADDHLAANGTSCQTQLEDLYDHQTDHPVELIAPPPDQYR
ncbi:MAG: LUD domain-containing protein, partial [Halodesulfurarchaeum sp.]